MTYLRTGRAKNTGSISNSSYVALDVCDSQTPSFLMEIKRISRFRHPFTVGYIDLDNFKMVNDRLGHNSGDLLLHAVAVTMLNIARETDSLARIGGDEFAVLLPETGFQPSQILFEKLQAHLLDIMEKNNWPVTFSIGVVTFIEPPDSAEDMLDRVDKIMYDVKNSGKGTTRHAIFGRQ